MQISPSVRMAISHYPTLFYGFRAVTLSGGIAFLLSSAYCFSANQVFSCYFGLHNCGICIIFPWPEIITPPWVFPETGKLPDSLTPSFLSRQTMTSGSKS
ncbi:hypothetical protein [Erwinia psidii]|uniref:hypothetical protein n=1 Tax=Erwinia psidii TaxID=69224 RepID=UPI000F522DD7|nr:hypothetical protein [Erwinia psidii]MCX8956218.1 hypothetical protein [Erwinia psidii]MCX8960022.1 hypothetical protein [Erwinia psidii]MCX8963567.1 hypothetical protein [Erwinia psidii]